MKIKHLFNKFENLLFTNHSCIGCEKEIIDGTKYSICNKCLEKLQKIDNNEASILSGYSTKYFFDKAISFYAYNDISSIIVKKFKYLSRKYFAKYMADMMTENLDLFNGVDLITFVPITKNRLKKRGYNQARELANEISKITNVPITELIIKNKDTKNQAELSREERFENLENCFEISNNYNDINDKRIIIIDDVFTTGTTLNRCSEVIMNCKPKEIIVMTFARVVHNKIEE